jgi:DNA-binding NarL/FixJ family response regulator
MPLRILVIDDDHNALNYVRYVVNQQFPTAHVECRERPDASGRFDVYLVDNDFGGNRIAARLTEEVRLVNPDALIVAFSASLDTGSLKALLNAGCDAVADKSDVEEQRFLLDMIGRYQDVYQRRPKLSTIQSIRSLLHQWRAPIEAGVHK